MSTSRRTTIALAVVLALSSALALVGAHASVHRLTAHDSDRRWVEATGLADLSLNSAVRWLRHPSQAEPAAPFSDGPASLDTDPAGAIVGPPRPLYRGSSER